MQQKYYPPKHIEQQFHCIHCGVYAKQTWHKFYEYNSGTYHAHFDYCVCEHCHKWSYWFDGRMIVPCEAPVPPAHIDMPEECLLDYNEARSIVAISPRAAAALVRLALEKLMIALGEKAKINDAIGSLVKKGLPIEVQQALDFCRVVGNNAVHAGEIEINDTPEIAHQLFIMMNFIVEDRISRPKHIESLYAQLPEGVREAIEKRDKPKT